MFAFGNDLLFSALIADNTVLMCAWSAFLSRGSQFLLRNNPKTLASHLENFEQLSSNFGFLWSAYISYIPSESILDPDL